MNNKIIPLVLLGVITVGYSYDSSVAGVNDELDTVVMTQDSKSMTMGGNVIMAARSTGQPALAPTPKWTSSAGNALHPSPRATRVMIGNGSPTNPLHISGNFDASVSGARDSGAIRISNGTRSMRIDDNEIMATKSFPATSELAATEMASTLYLNREGGSVHIGKVAGPAQSEGLLVSGAISAKEIIVTPDGWADDVFNSGYEMRSIDELDHFVHSNAHLPGIPSEEVVLSEGLGVANFSKNILRNVEELTLRVIEQSKLLEAQQEAHLQEIQVLRKDYDDRIRSLEVLTNNKYADLQGRLR